MNKLLIVLLSVLAACSYGVLHDEITARVCLEYFTIAHPHLFPTSSPTLLALCWGIAATAGIGLALGAVLAVVAQAGETPPWPLSSVARSILLLLAVMGTIAASAGAIGYGLAARGFISLPASIAASLPATIHDRFMGVWWAHCASYLVGLVGAGVLCYHIWRARGRPPVISVFPRTRGACLRAAVLAAAVGCILWFRLTAR